MKAVDMTKRQRKALLLAYRQKNNDWQEFNDNFMEPIGEFHGHINPNMHYTTCGHPDMRVDRWNSRD